MRSLVGSVAYHEAVKTYPRQVWETSKGRVTVSTSNYLTGLSNKQFFFKVRSLMGDRTKVHGVCLYALSSVLLTDPQETISALKHALKHRKLSRPEQNQVSQWLSYLTV